MKRVTLLIVSLLMPFIAISVAQLFERTTSSTAVALENHIRTVFAINASKKARMVLKDIQV